MSKATRPTLAEKAYAELQSQIVSGVLPAGKRLMAEELAEQLDSSPTPIKEAMTLLERDGLIEGNARRASAVRRYTHGDIVEIYEARLFLELNAILIGRRTGRVTPSFLVDLQRAHEAQMHFADQHTRAGLGEAIRCDREFHEIIVGLTRNKVMQGWHRTILRQTQTLRTHSLESYDVVRSRQDHAAIIEALRKGESGEAARLLRAHLNGSRDILTSQGLHKMPRD
jgi:DNA-binding GntR family transcriptional regulator